MGPFPAESGPLGKAFTLVNDSIRFYRTLYLLGHFCSDNGTALGANGNGRLSHDLAAEKKRYYK